MSKFSIVVQRASFLFLLFLCFNLLLSTPASSAPKVELTWSANSEPDFAGNKVYIGQVPGQYGSPYRCWT